MHPVGPEDWRGHRDLRLEMLLDAPDAFWTQHSDVADLDEAAWRARIAGQHHLQARIDGDPVGSVGIFDDPDEAADAATLVAMYVTPRGRGCGVGVRLVQAVLDEAVARGKGRVVLEVVSGNEAAIGLYGRMGFRFTGRQSPHPRRADLVELTMERRLADGAVPATDPGAASTPTGTRIPRGGRDVEG